MEMQFRPLTQWPGQPTAKRKPSLFRARYADTLRLLDTELRHLQASQVVIQAACGEEDIRLDGQLRASAKLASPAIILSFNSKHGPLSYPCDRYTAWQDNLRAIALALQALRAVDRYGVTRRAEQYRGWQALPEAPQPQTGSVVWARQVIQQIVGGVTWRDPYQRNAIREAQMATHPDRGGNAEDFKRVMEAVRILGL